MLLDLPSSASAVDFADNTNNNFKVRLQRKLVLKPGELEGGGYGNVPNKFYNIVAGELTLLSRTSRTKQKYRVTPGFYRTPDSLLVEIKKSNTAVEVRIAECCISNTTKQQTRSIWILWGMWR